MDLRFEVEEFDTLVVHLRDAEVDTTVTVRPAAAGIQSLARAVGDAAASGYGECFWPDPEGQYWWMFKREAETMEVIAMYTRGGATGWQHVFRATDSVDWVRQRLDEEAQQLR